MRCLKPSPGELADRQSILELKIDHIDTDFDETTKMPSKEGGAVVARTIITNKNKTSPHAFMDELDLVRNKLSTAWVQDISDKPGAIETYDTLYTQLAETNAKLWDLEDEIRDLYAAPDNVKDQQNYLIQVRDVAFGIMESNNRRMHLIGEINKLWGMETKEKLYETSN